MVVDQEELDALREKERQEKTEREWKNESQAIQRFLPRPFEINAQVWSHISLPSLNVIVFFCSFFFLSISVIIYTFILLRFLMSRTFEAKYLILPFPLPTDHAAAASS